MTVCPAWPGVGVGAWARQNSLMPSARLPSLHPAALIALWAAYAAGLEFLSWPGLVAAAAVVAPALFNTPARAGFLQLLRRSRWLLLFLPVVYALSIPGQPVWPGISAVSWPGIEDGALRTVRLLLMLAALSGVLAALEPARLIFGLYSIARPFAHFGLDVRALAVRLSLVLEGACHAAPAKPWRLALVHLEDAPQQASAQIVLQPQPWAWRDTAVLLLAAGWLGAVLA